MYQIPIYRNNVKILKDVYIIGATLFINLKIIFIEKNSCCNSTFLGFEGY